LIELIIGPDPTAEAHFGATLKVWGEFTRRLAAPLPFDLARVQEAQFQEHSSGVAVAMPKLRDAPSSPWSKSR
jgi:hypothetical protein